MIGPDIELTFFGLGWRLVREKTDLCPFFCQIWSEFCFGPPCQLPGVLAYLDAVKNAPINKHDPVLVLSIDGAQLYRNKKLNCWMYIWILLNLGPDERYKIRSILPGGIIPGPKHPKNLDSFLLPGLAHVAALQKEGLPVWDAYNHIRVVCFIYLFLVLADAVAMASVSGAVGHHGRKGCRLLCGFAG